VCGVCVCVLCVRVRVGVGWCVCVCGWVCVCVCACAICHVRLDTVRSLKLRPILHSRNTSRFHLSLCKQEGARHNFACVIDLVL